MRHSPVAGPKPTALVTWYLFDPDGWIVRDGSPECEHLIGHCLWEVFPHLEVKYRPFHELALERGEAEFFAADQGHVYLVSSRPSGKHPGLLYVVNIDLAHFRRSLRRLDDPGQEAASGRARPALHAVQ